MNDDVAKLKRELEAARRVVDASRRLADALANYDRVLQEEPPGETECVGCDAMFVPEEKDDMYCPKCVEEGCMQCGCRGYCLCWTR